MAKNSHFRLFLNFAKTVLTIRTKFSTVIFYTIVWSMCAISINSYDWDSSESEGKRPKPTPFPHMRLWFLHPKKLHSTFTKLFEKSILILTATLRLEVLQVSPRNGAPEEENFIVGIQLEEILEKRVDYSHGFSSVYFYFKKFFGTPEVTKIVLPQKFYKILNCPCWPRELHQKGFPRNIQYCTRPKGPLFNFFRHCETFFKEKFSSTLNEDTWHFEVLLLFLSLRYGADLGRSRLFTYGTPGPFWKPTRKRIFVHFELLH